MQPLVTITPGRALVEPLRLHTLGREAYIIASGALAAGASNVEASFDGVTYTAGAPVNGGYRWLLAGPGFAESGQQLDGAVVVPHTITPAVRATVGDEVLYLDMEETPRVVITSSPTTLQSSPTPATLAYTTYVWDGSGIPTRPAAVVVQWRSPTSPEAHMAVGDSWIMTEV